MVNNVLKAAIILKYGSQADFAEATGMREDLVSRVVHGRRTLSAEERRYWSERLGIEPTLFEAE